MNIFVSTSGVISLRVAKALKDWLRKVLPNVKLWISDEDMAGGKYWQTILSHQLNELHACITVITKENINAPWIYFESGALSKNTQQSVVLPYLFNLEIPDIHHTPLAQFQGRIANKEGTRKLILDLNNNLPNKSPEDSINFLFNNTWHVLDEELNRISNETNYLNHLADNKIYFNNLLNQAGASKILEENSYLREVISHSMEELSDTLKKIIEGGKSYSVPYILYPEYLVTLLKSFNTITKAIAIVDKDETFWSEKQGNEIFLNTHKQSTRIFAFREKAHLRKYLSIIKNHAAKYDVFVIDYDILTRIYLTKPYDFSIIGDINATSLLALYDDEHFIKKIKFTADKNAISRHHDVLTQILDASLKIDKRASDEEIIGKAFSPNSLSKLELRHIEMSSYIHPNEYHLHEEKHAYYIDMADRMIAICKTHNSQNNNDDTIRALEFGGGTGLFTKRLLSLKNIDLTTVEIDWACYVTLLENMMKIPGMGKSNLNKSYSAKLQDTFESEELKAVVHCINEDCRTYNPPGKFNFIFSSFADHHIKTYDKLQYFKNIKNNLVPGGIVIIGDEILPSYDENNPDEREIALRSYHAHIIEETKNNYGNEASGLVKLEEAALESGLKSLGDFKLSCELYEKYLVEAGFNFKKELIGPKNKNVGGIYVYVLTTS